MSTDFNKKFDPIPVLPPGIAPPLPKANEPAPMTQTVPPLPTKAAPAKAEAKKTIAKKADVPSWLQSVFAPSKNKGVVAVAAASLFAGWYGVRTVFPPTPKVETVAEVTSESPPALPDATVQSLIEIPVASATTTTQTSPGFLPPITIPEFKPAPSSVPVPAVDLNLLAGNTGTTPLVPVPVVVPQPTPIVPVGHFDVPLPTIPPAATTPATSPATSQPEVIIPVTSGPIPVSPVVIPTLPNLVPPPVNEKKPEPTPAPLLAIPSLPDATGTTAPSSAPPAAAPPAITVPSAASPTVGGSSLVVPDLGTSRTTLPAMTVPSVPVPTTTTPPAVIPITPLVRPDPVFVPAVGSPVSTAPLTEKPGTDFDVDLHYPKANESYASIAKQHYGDEKYGTILAQFNQANNAGNNRAIQVPPVWWVKKQAGAPAARPANNETPKTENWSPAAATAGYRFYTVPASATGSMTFREIAKLAYGSDQEWQRVFDLNQTYPSDAMLPAGTRVRLTADAKVGQ